MISSHLSAKVLLASSLTTWAVLLPLVERVTLKNALDYRANGLTDY